MPLLVEGLFSLLPPPPPPSLLDICDDESEACRLIESSAMERVGSDGVVMEEEEGGFVGADVDRAVGAARLAVVGAGGGGAAGVGTGEAPVPLST